MALASQEALLLFDWFGIDLSPKKDVVCLYLEFLVFRKESIHTKKLITRLG